MKTIKKNKYLKYYYINKLYLYDDKIFFEFKRIFILVFIKLYFELIE